jgi:hypothetical protein
MKRLLALGMLLVFLTACTQSQNIGRGKLITDTAPIDYANQTFKVGRDGTYFVHVDDSQLIDGTPVTLEISWTNGNPSTYHLHIGNYLDAKGIEKKLLPNMFGVEYKIPDSAVCTATVFYSVSGNKFLASAGYFGNFISPGTMTLYTDPFTGSKYCNR